MKPLQFDIRNLPAEGKQMTGTLPGTVFQLGAAEMIQPVSPVDYDLHVVRDGKDVVITGRLGATFELECGRCLEKFEQRVELDGYQSEIPIEKETTMDLTELVREDILLALPNFPRCEDGNVTPRDCPAEGKFEPAALAAEGDEAPAGDPKVWEALDKLK